MSNEGSCPDKAWQPTEALGQRQVRTIRKWWPNQLDIELLHQHSSEFKPNG